MSSDYIPRVGAWCIDAMIEMGILQYEEKETTIMLLIELLISHVV